MNSEITWFQPPLSLDTIYQEIWRHLAAAPMNRLSGWRLPVLATCDRTSECRQRIVVLRQVDVNQRTLFVHTDVRSPKVASIRSDAHTSWLFYEPTQQVQIQLTGEAHIHTSGEIADQLWNQESEAALRGYLAPRPPGTVSRTPDINLPDNAQNRIPHRSELTEARQNFAVISCRVDSMEWLLLRRTGNLRAFFDCRGSDPAAEWLAP